MVGGCNDHKIVGEEIRVSFDEREVTSIWLSLI